MDTVIVLKDKLASLLLQRDAVTENLDKLEREVCAQEEEWESLDDAISGLKVIIKELEAL